MNIAVLGAVDASKSSTVGVLTKGVLDDGNGFARSLVMRHSHERVSGRTSDIGYERFSKGIYFVDLAGHESYLRTTLRGLTTYYPSCAMVLVNLNKGMTRITKEHFLVCRYLDIPVILVFTKVDLCPLEKDNTETQVSIRKQETIKEVHDFAKRSGIKFLYEINAENGLDVLGKFRSNPTVVCPYICISNKTGEMIEPLKSFIMSLPMESSVPISHLSAGPLRKYATQEGLTHVFISYKPFCIKGIGWILHGFNAVGNISKGDHLYIGPLPIGEKGKSGRTPSFGAEYVEVRIRSIHNEERDEVDTLPEGESGCIAIRPLDTKVVLTTNRLSGGKVGLSRPVSTPQIRAEIYVCSSRVSITRGIELYLHSSNVGVVSHIANVDNEKGILRYQETGSVIIRLETPQFVYPGARLILRDGNVRAVGIIREVIV